jgi:uncharacterized protein YlxW (UPF0749 family)
MCLLPARFLPSVECQTAALCSCWLLEPLCALQMGVLCAQTQQLSREVEQVTGEKAQAEQQVGELRAVQGQLELEVARLQHQLQGLEGQLQVSTMLQGQCVLLHMQLMCSCLFGQSTRLCLSCCSVLCILRTALPFAYEVNEHR